jgi:uncharacterized protein YbaR (Trm112 family)
VEEFMKLWLFDILACPIDKHFPLILYIFSFENEPEEFQSIIDTYVNRKIEVIKKERIIEIFHEGTELYLKDNIIIEKTKLKQYLNTINSSLLEFENVFDKSFKQLGKKCFEILNSGVKSKLTNFSEDPQSDQLDKILPELYFVNKIKLELEIESGILFCSECKRWYPIIDTIPQMLPDKYRDEKKDTTFLKNHKNLLDDRFLNQDLKPFKI